MEHIIEKIAEDMKAVGHVRATIRDAETGEIKRIHDYYNIVPTAGRELLWKQIDPNFVSTDNVISHAVVGDSTTPPAASDVQLGNEIYRNLVSSWNVDGKTFYATGFFDKTEANGTIREAGLIIAGDSLADTGTLLSHVAMNVTKSSSETLTLDWTINLNV